MIHTDGVPTIAMRESDAGSQQAIEVVNPTVAEDTLEQPYFDNEGHEGTLGEVHA